MGGHVGLDTWRTREWYPALDAAGLRRRGPYQLRHTFATAALAAGISIFELARVMGASVKTIDKALRPPGARLRAGDSRPVRREGGA
jgi:integrase